MEQMTGNETYQILLKGSEMRSVVEDWYERNIQCDIIVRRAKTRGCAVVETKDVMFANHIIRWHPDCKVHIKQ